MNLHTALRLGRISNLPTVWTNVLSGALLAGAALDASVLAPLMLALSAFYVGGMFLNDAYDAAFDTEHRPERPIPAGKASRREVFTWGYGLMAAGWLGVAAMAAVSGQVLALLWAALLAGAIVHYNAHHKNNPWSPLVMGLCRVGVVLTSAYAAAPTPQPALWLAALALLCHLIGLTYIAKQEHLNRLGALWPLGFLALPVCVGTALALAHPLAWAPLAAYSAVLVFALSRLRRRAPGDVPRAVVTLIAGMSLLDAVLLAGAGQPAAALVAVLAFVLTLALQRWVAGT